MSAQLGNILYFLLLAGLFVVMMRFGCGAHVMGHGHHHGAKSSDDQANDSNVRLGHDGPDGQRQVGRP
jgi:hypothetical protein